METSRILSRLWQRLDPHSLGILIEWKPAPKSQSPDRVLGHYPHSLGILIEWKLTSTCGSLPDSTALDPHSLGILIEWKLIRLIICTDAREQKSPLAGDPN